MAYLVRVQGVAGSPQAGTAVETWSFGTWWDNIESVTAPDQDTLDEVATGALAAARTFIGSADMRFSSNVHVTEARVYEYATGASPRPPASKIGYSTGASQAGSSEVFYPLENSVVVSLEADGRVTPKRGRFYLPPMDPMLQNDSRMTAARATQIATNARTFLTSVDSVWNDAAGGDWELRIVSWGTPSRPSYAARPVRTVRVGRVVDTQRRRRRSQVESYSDLGYPS